MAVNSLTIHCAERVSRPVQGSGDCSINAGANAECSVAIRVKWPIPKEEWFGIDLLGKKKALLENNCWKNAHNLQVAGSSTLR